MSPPIGDPYNYADHRCLEISCGLLLTFPGQGRSFLLEGPYSMPGRWPAQDAERDNPPRERCFLAGTGRGIELVTWQEVERDGWLERWRN